VVRFSWQDLAWTCNCNFFGRCAWCLKHGKAHQRDYIQKFEHKRVLPRIRCNASIQSGLLVSCFMEHSFEGVKSAVSVPTRAIPRGEQRLRYPCNLSHDLFAFEAGWIPKSDRQRRKDDTEEGIHAKLQGICQGHVCTRFGQLFHS